MSDLLQLGLDVTQIRKSLEAVEKHFEASMSRNAKAAEKTTSVIGRMANGIKAMLGAAVVRQLAKNTLDLGKDFEAATEKFIAGSEKLKAATGGGAPSDQAGISVAASSKLEDFTNKAKRVSGEALASLGGLLKIAGEGAKGFFAGGLLGGNAIGNSAEAMDKEVKEQIRLADLGNEVLANKAAIEAKQSEIAELESEGLSTSDSQLTLLKKQQELQELIRKAAEHELVSNKNEANAAKAAYGAAMKAQHDIAFSKQQELNAAMAATDAMEMEVKGQKGVAEIIKIKAKYEAQILAAQKSGNTELQKELAIQRDIELTRARVAEHLKKPAERQAERQEARKYARDKRKTEAAEASLEERSKSMSSGGLRSGGLRSDGLKTKGLDTSGTHRATPGSELDRYMQRGTGRVGGNTNWQEHRDILNKIERNTQTVNDNL